MSTKTALPADLAAIRLYELMQALDKRTVNYRKAETALELITQIRQAEERSAA